MLFLLVRDACLFCKAGWETNINILGRHCMQINHACVSVLSVGCENMGDISCEYENLKKKSLKDKRFFNGILYILAKSVGTHIFVSNVME